MAENQEQKSRRDAFNERLKAKYPDREYADDEALFGQIDDDYADYEKRLGEAAERQKKHDDEALIIEETFKKDPRNAQFFVDIMSGKDAFVALIKRIGSEGIIELLNDPEKEAEYAAANKEYAENLAKERDLEAQVEVNKAESQKVVEQMNAKYGAENVDAALAIIDGIWHDAVLGIVTPATLEMAMNIVRRDADLANARQEGELAGRNAKIVDKLQKQNGGDGMPAMGGSNTVSAAPKRNLNVFDYAAAAS